MDEKFIQERINELRMKKNISEYQLSLELGHSQGYGSMSILWTKKVERLC